MGLPLLRVMLSLAVIGAIACDAPAQSAASPTAISSATPAPVASPTPARTPRPDEDQLIVQALAQAGIRVTSFPSKFDWLFGNDAPRSGNFQGAIDGTPVWADVHFLNRKLDGITACLEQNPTRETAFTVSVQGRPQVLGAGSATGYIGSAGPMYFAVSERIFVMAPDARMRDALVSSLGLAVLSAPPC